MKTLTVTVGGVLSAAAAASIPVLIGLAALAAAAIGLLCWIVANRCRTENAVALITASRRTPRAIPPTPHRRRKR